MTPLFIAIRRACRFSTLAVLGLALAQLGGCALFRPAPRTPLKLPSDFHTNPQTAALAQPRQAAFKSVFPELSSVQASGSAVISSILKTGKDPFDFTYYSLTHAVPAGHMLRMQGTRGAGMTSLFDISVRGRTCLVVLYPPIFPKVYFQGDIPAKGSPLAELFGVELWDLARVFAIGQRVAAIDCKAVEKRDRTILTPRDRKAASGLRRIELEKRSGLPWAAEWVMNGKTYRIQYLGWESFKDSLTGNTRLMPTEVQIRRRGVLIDMNLRKYQYDKQPSDQLFNINTARLLKDGFRQFPLEKLKEAM